MAFTEIKASKKIDGVDKAAAIAYDFGDTLKDSVEKFGEAVIFTNFKRTAVITAQAAMRRMLEGGKTEEQIVEAMGTWKPGVALDRTVDPVGSLVSKFDSYSKEEQDEIIKKLKAKMGKGK